MEHGLRAALEELARRGEPRGADRVVSAALVAADLRPLREPEPEATGQSTRRLLVRRLVLAAAAAMVTTAVVATAGVVYLREKTDDIATVDVAAALVGGGAATPAQPMTVLLVGTDQRDGLSGSRADTIMLLRIDPEAHRAAFLSVPRDLWVPLAGQGRDQRINTALDVGVDVLVRTIGEVLGVPVDHYVQVDFDGFRRMVDVLGGVDVAFDAPARDTLSGLHVPAAGCVRLDGDQALALVRSRHFQQLLEGRWVSDPTGDLGRIERQQAFLLAVLADVAAARNPLTINRLADVAVDHLVVDDALSIDELVQLGRRLRGFDLRTVPLLTVPATPVVVGEAAVLALDETGAAAAVDELLEGTRGPAAPSGRPSPGSPPRASGC